MSLFVAALAASTLLRVPFVPQGKDACGAAALAMVLAYWDRPVPPETIAGALLQKELRGIAGSDLAAFARERGFLAVPHEGDAAALRQHLSRGRPVIVAWRLGRGRYHDVVVVGHDPAREEFVVHDPARSAGRRIDAATFEKRWSGAGHWSLLVLPGPP